jgi:hypothetical protein
MRQFDKVMMVEFNELSPPLMFKWMDMGLLPNFKALHQQSTTFITQSDNSSAHDLEPWIQWYSLHTGLAYEQHGVFHLTDGPRKNFDDIYTTLMSAGLNVGCGGSMNVKGFAKEGSFFISDPWCGGQDASPASLNIFQRFVAQNVQEYSNPDAKSENVTAAKFVAFMAKHGLSAATATNIVRQLLDEKLKDKKWSWRRAFILDQLSLDLFTSLYKEYKPDFSTFFSNSTAHLQHSYWRHMDPDAFTVKPSQSDMPIYGDAIFLGYKEMDKMLGRLQSLVGPRDLLVFATGLSQQPFLRKEADGGQHFYRLRNVESFLKMLNIEYKSVEPVMTHQFMMRFENDAQSKHAMERLSAVRLGNLAAFGFHDNGTTDIYFGLEPHHQIEANAVLTTPHNNSSWRFFDMAYQIEAIKSGCHHPDGMLWFQTGTHMDAGRCSILDVYPTLLNLFNQDSKIGADRRGQSLTPYLMTASQRKAA